ncbi:MAG: TolC family protein [Deltaproteobacteria bacterium]|nr:TolC family protein [Deltaproteobacteria bacterium]
MMLLLSVVLAAETPPGFTRREALDRAAQHGPELIASGKALAVSEAGVRTAAAWPNPTLGVSYGPDEPKLFGTVDQKFPIFGQRGAAIDAARADLDAAKAALAAERLDGLVTVDRAYTALAAAVAQVDVSLDAASLARQLVDKTKGRVDAHQAPELELEEAQLAAKRAEQDAVDRAALVEGARARLAALLGLAIAPGVDPKDALLPMPALPAPSNEEPPQVRVSEATRVAAERKADRERAAIRPTPEVTVELERLGSDTGPTVFGVRGTVAVDVPAFSQNGGNVAAQVAQADQASARANAARAHFEAERAAALARWRAAVARAQFEVAEDVPVAVRVRDLARAAQEKGKIPLIALIAAETDVSHSRAAAIDAQAAVWDARDDLLAATGGTP